MLRPFLLPHLAISLLGGLAVTVLALRSLPPALRRRGILPLALFAVASVILWVADNVAGPGDSATPARLAAAFWWLSGIHLVLRLLDLAVWEPQLSRRVERPFPRLLVDVFNVAMLLLVAMVALDHYFPGQLRTLLVTSTIASAAIGLALQDALRGVVAGLVLQAESPFALGDWVAIAGHEGRVAQMNWRTATLRTREGNWVVIGNDKVTAADIVNYSRPDPRHAQDAQVAVAYGHPPEQVKDVLLAALREQDGVLAEPAPYAYTEAYQDSGVLYRVRFWIDDPERSPRIREQALSRFWYGLARAGMAIPFPIRDVNLRRVAPDAEARQGERERSATFRVLRPLALLAPLSDEQVSTLAGGAERRTYAPGETILREGEAGDSLLVIRRGRLAVEVSGPDGRPVALAERGPGEIVGEMSLLTGAPRSATIRAASESEIILVGKALFGQVLLADPAVADALSAILVSRALEQQSRLAEARPEAPPPSPDPRLRDEVLGRIRGFFGLADGA